MQNITQDLSEAIQAARESKEKVNKLYQKAVADWNVNEKPSRILSALAIADANADETIKKLVIAKLLHENT